MACAEGHIFIANGDLTHLTAHAVAYSTSNRLRRDGNLYPAFARHVAGFDRLYASLPSGCEIGESFWLPLPDNPSLRGVVVVASTGRDSSLSRLEKARRAVRSALQRSIRELRRVYPEPERLLVALPTFRHGMGGDRHIRLESAQAQLATAREVLRDHPAVDVAFVPYTADSYRIYLQARRDLGLAPACPVDAPSLPGLLAALRERRCVLFVGAGMSAGAGLPSWKSLVDQLAADLGVPSGPRDDLEYYLDLAQWYVEKHGPAGLTALIAGLFGGGQARPTLAQYLLMSLPVRVVITTNYDDLLERTLTALRRHPVTVVEEKDVVLTGRADGVCVVKLHGDAAQGRGIVLCRDDYDGFFRKRPAMALLLEGLLLNQTFLFAGYGLRDPNFRQIYSRIADMLQGARREAFALTVEAGSAASPFLAGQWQRKGLHLLTMPGDTAEVRVQASLRMLDWLADQVTLQGHDLFLARDVPGDGTLEPLRQILIEEVGREVEQGCLRPHSESEARHLAEVLAFLTEHGWRPSPNSRLSLWELWERLADGCPDRAGRRRLLVTALRYTERIDHDEHLRKRLMELDGDG
jgi:hypothetical protein